VRKRFAKQVSLSRMKPPSTRSAAASWGFVDGILDRSRLVGLWEALDKVSPRKGHLANLATAS
jgi:hypothetical protein